jgi:hypothetical protein
MSADSLVGNWKLVSWQVVVEDEARDLFGSKPKGYLILTREGRAMALTTAEARTPGETEPDRAALHKSMLAYTGMYRLEGDEFITTVDASWNENWNGTEQRRSFKIDGDKLFIESAPAPSILFPGKFDNWHASSTSSQDLGIRNPSRDLTPVASRPRHNATHNRWK